MRERLKVTPAESAVILLNEVFSNSLNRALNRESRGQYSEKIAKILHGQKWKDWYPGTNPLTPDSFLQDQQKSALLLETVDRVLETLKPREKIGLRKRFGFHDGQLHTLKEVGEELSSVSGDRAEQIINRSLRKLRHPSRSKHFVEFLP